VSVLQPAVDPTTCGSPGPSVTCGSPGPSVKAGFDEDDQLNESLPFLRGGDSQDRHQVQALRRVLDEEGAGFSTACAEGSDDRSDREEIQGDAGAWGAALPCGHRRVRHRDGDRHRERSRPGDFGSVLVCRSWPLRCRQDRCMVATRVVNAGTGIPAVSPNRSFS